MFLFEPKTTTKIIIRVELFEVQPLSLPCSGLFGLCDVLVYPKFAVLLFVLLLVMFTPRAHEFL